MCFRPTDAVKNVKCPSCGMFNPPTLLKCRKCGTAITQQEVEKEKSEEK